MEGSFYTDNTERRLRDHLAEHKYSRQLTANDSLLHQLWPFIFNHTTLPSHTVWSSVSFISLVLIGCIMFFAGQAGYRLLIRAYVNRLLGWLLERIRWVQVLKKHLHH